MIYFFWIFHYSIIPLNKFASMNDILLVLFKKIIIFITFVILSVKDKHSLLLFKSHIYLYI